MKKNNFKVKDGSEKGYFALRCKGLLKFIKSNLAYLISGIVLAFLLWMVLGFV